MLHNEVDGIASFAAAEAFVDTLGGGYVEGGGFLVVERAEADVVRASLFQADAIGDDVLYVGCVTYLLYGRWINHTAQITRKGRLDTEIKKKANKNSYFRRLKKMKG